MDEPARADMTRSIEPPQRRRVDLCEFRVCTRSKRLLRKCDYVDFAHGQAAAPETEVDRAKGDAGIVPYAAKTLFFGRGHDAAVTDERGGSVVHVVPVGKRENVHAALPPCR